jgi:hypothetical protein
MPGWIKISIDETCHVVWQVKRHGTAGKYLHAIGDGAEGNRVTDEMAEKRFHAGRCKTPWLPVLFPDRATLYGQRSQNCVTAASRALWRGWFYGR